MAMHKMIIPPDSNGFSAIDGNEILSVQLDGGSSRYRADILNSNAKVSAIWTLDQQQFNYFKTFFKVFINQGADPFLIDIFLDDGFGLTEVEAHFVPGSVSLKSQSGLAFIMSATLEVKPVSLNQDRINIDAMYELWQDTFDINNDIFDNLINVKIPADYP